MKTNTIARWRGSCFAIVLFITLFYCPAVSAESQDASGVTVGSIIERSREYLNEATASFWSDSRMIDHVNSAVMRVASMSKCMEGTESLTLVTATTQYAISSTYLTVENATYSGSTTISRSSASEKGLDRIDIRDYGRKGEDPGEPIRYCIWGDFFLVEPVPSSSVSGNTITLYYSERPSTLNGTSAIPTPAQYDHAIVLYTTAQSLKKGRYWNVARYYEQAFIEEMSLVMDSWKIRREKAKDSEAMSFPKLPAITTSEPGIGR